MSLLPDKGKVSRDDAILAMKMSNDGRTITLTMAPGWEDVLPQTNDNDPGSLIMWDVDHCIATVKAFNIAIAKQAANPNPNEAVPPEWLNMAVGQAGITVAGLQAAVLAHVQVAAGGGGVVGNALIAPNTMEEYCRVRECFLNIGYDPFFKAHAVCPIGRNYVLADCTKKTTAVASPIVPPSAGLGVPVIT
jgi:hypothetical protein